MTAALVVVMITTHGMVDCSQGLVSSSEAKMTANVLYQENEFYANQ